MTATPAKISSGPARDSKPAANQRVSLAA